MEVPRAADHWRQWSVGLHSSEREANIRAKKKNKKREGRPSLPLFHLAHSICDNFATFFLFPTKISSFCAISKDVSKLARFVTIGQKGIEKSVFWKVYGFTAEDRTSRSQSNLEAQRSLVRIQVFLLFIFFIFLLSCKQAILPECLPSYCYFYFWIFFKKIAQFCVISKGKLILARSAIFGQRGAEKSAFWLIRWFTAAESTIPLFSASFHFIRSSLQTNTFTR